VFAKSRKVNSDSDQPAGRIFDVSELTRPPWTRFAGRLVSVMKTSRMPAVVEDVLSDWLLSRSTGSTGPIALMLLIVKLSSEKLRTPAEVFVGSRATVCMAPPLTATPIKIVAFAVAATARPAASAAAGRSVLRAFLGEVPS
jgi:hypothetical protein